MLKAVALFFALTAVCQGKWRDDRSWEPRFDTDLSPPLPNPVVRLNDQLLNLRRLLRKNLVVVSADDFNAQKQLFTYLAGGLLLKLRKSQVSVKDYVREKGLQGLGGAVRNELDLYSALLSQPSKDVKLACRPEVNAVQCQHDLTDQQKKLLQLCPDYKDQLELFENFLLLGLDSRAENLLSELLNLSLKEDVDQADKFLETVYDNYPDVLKALKRLRVLAKEASFNCLKPFNLAVKN